MGEIRTLNGNTFVDEKARETDSSLSISGVAADAAAVGKRVALLSEETADVSGTLTSIIDIQKNIVSVNDDSFIDLSSDTTGKVVYCDGGFEFTRGTAANYSVVVVFPTQIGKKYDVAFDFESGTMLYGGIAINGDHPNAPTYIPSARIVEFSTGVGQKNVSFTATGASTIMYFAIAYNSPVFKISNIFCHDSGSTGKIKTNVLPDEINDIAINTETIGRRITFVEKASDFVETSTVIRSDGVRVAKNNRPSTGYIDIRGCTSIRFGLNQYRESGSEVYNVISFYDENKEYISGLPSPTNGYVESVIGVPENAAYVVGSWLNSLTAQPYMIGICGEGLVEKVISLRAIDTLNVGNCEEVVSATMNLEEFVAAINAKWGTYAALCKCVPWCFMPLRYVDSSYKIVPFADMCEVINKNFRAEVANPEFSFAENCKRINNAFTKPIYRFADAKLNTKSTDNFAANLKSIIDFSLDTDMAKVEPSVIVSDDGNTMYIYAYNYRISTVDGVNWTAPVPLVMNGHAGLVHVNVNYMDGTFYLLGCDSNTDGTFGMMTSTDGINFTYKGKMFLEGHEFTTGKPVKQWGNSCIIKEYGSGTYYMYVEYRTDMTSGWEIGVVTATDLNIANANGTVGNWQNAANNPVMSKLWLNLDGTNTVGAGNPDFAKGEDNRPVKVNGRYFMLVHSSHQNSINLPGLTTFTNGSQSNIIRLSSANLIDWEVDGLLFDNRDIPLDDNPTSAKATSGNADCCIIQFKGRTYLFYSWNINHQTSGTAEYVKYTIDDRPIREILSLRP